MSIMACSIAKGLAAINLRNQISVLLVKAASVTTGLSCSILRGASEQPVGAGKSGSLLGAAL